MESGLGTIFWASPGNPTHTPVRVKPLRRLLIAKQKHATPDNLYCFCTSHRDSREGATSLANAPSPLFPISRVGGLRSRIFLNTLFRQPSNFLLITAPRRPSPASCPSSPPPRPRRPSRPRPTRPALPREFPRRSRKQPPPRQSPDRCKSSALVP